MRSLGTDYFDEAIAYLERHQLYEPALSIWRRTDRYSVRQLFQFVSGLLWLTEFNNSLY